MTRAIDDRAAALEPASRRVLEFWMQLAPPLRPSPEDIAALERLWNPPPAPRVLILGATPELIDLALRRGARRVVAMDWQAAVFPAMRALATTDWTGVESVVRDWREPMPELDGGIDTVFGDGSTALLTFPDDWTILFRTVYRYLVPGGQLLLRTGIRPEPPFEFEPYFRDALARFDADCAAARDGPRAALMRGLLSELWMARGLGAARADGTIDTARRAVFTELVNRELTARYGHWDDWPTLSRALPRIEPEGEKEMRGRGGPSREQAAGVFDACGFDMEHDESHSRRPAPGVMRIFGLRRRSPGHAPEGKG